MTDHQFHVTPEEDNRELDTRFEAEREEAEDLRGSLESGLAERKSAADADADLEEARPLREEIERRYSGRASEAIDTFLRIDEMMRADPTNGAFKAAEFYARNGARLTGAAAGSEKPDADGYVSVRLADGSTEKVLEGSVRHTALLSAARVKADQGEVDKLREQQKKFQQRFPGAKFNTVLQDALSFDRDATKDPYRAAALLAAKYGAAWTDEQATQQAARQEKVSANTAEITRLMETEFKSLDGRQAEIDELLSSGAVRPTGDLRRDLQTLTHVLDVRDGVELMRANKAKYPRLREVASQMVDLLSSGATRDVFDAYKRAAASGDPGLRDDIRTAAKRRL